MRPGAPQGGPRFAAASSEGCSAAGRTDSPGGNNPFKLPASGWEDSGAMSCGSAGAWSLRRCPARARTTPNSAADTAAPDGLPGRAAGPTEEGGQAATGRDNGGAGAVTRSAMQIGVQKGELLFSRGWEGGRANNLPFGSARANELPRAGPLCSSLSARPAVF